MNSRIKVSAVPAVLVAVLTAAVLAACQSGHPVAGSGGSPSSASSLSGSASPVPPDPSASPAPSGSAAGLAVGSDSGTGSGNGAAPAPCALRDVRITAVADPNGGAAGHHAFRLVFTNTSAASCTLAGRPRVWFVSGPTQPLSRGVATTSNGAPATTVTLAPGASGYTMVWMTQPDLFAADACRPMDAAGVLVSLSAGPESIYVGWHERVCSTAGVGTPSLYPFALLPAGS